jgi:glycosyltransferase involved in cell wall biosynthesis
MRSPQRQTVRRHCMVVHAYYPVREPRVEREARALIDQGYEVDVICLQGDGEPARATEHGVSVYRMPLKRHRGRGLWFQLLEYVTFFLLAAVSLTMLHTRRRYGVVQLHNPPDFLVFAALIPKLTGARVVLDIHDVSPEFYASRFNTTMDSWPVRLVRWQEQCACRFADLVITVTKTWQDTLIARGVAPHKVMVVMNVADDRAFHSIAAEDLPARTEGKFHILYHGTITKRYGIDLLIRAVADVRAQIPEVNLTIHGLGDYRDDLLRLASELDMDRHVTFSTHFVPTPELPAFIREADLAVVPYRRDVFTDGILPTKLMEYAAAGVPAIAARTPVIAAYFDDTMVQFFTPGDTDDLAKKILACYADRPRMVAMVQQARRFCERHNWSSVSAEYVARVDQLHTGTARMKAAAPTPTLDV